MALDPELNLTRDFYLTLSCTQGLPRASILAYQHKLLEKLVRHAINFVPFYRDSKRLAPLLAADGSFRFECWADIEPLTRKEARENEDKLVATQLPPAMAPTHSDMTSGSTGTPLRVQHTMLSRVASRALLGRAIRWHDEKPEQRILTIMALPDSTPLRPSAGALIVPADLAPDEQIRAIGDFRPTHVATYPNILVNVLKAASNEFEALRVAIVSGEQLTPTLRAAIAGATRARLVNCYAATEVGAVAYEDASGQLRVCEESVFVEHGVSALDELHTALITPFYSFAMPLIRYAPGDVIGKLVACEDALRGLRVLERVGGRERNLLRSPEGHLFFAKIRASNLSKILDYRDWQLRQVSRTEAVFHIETPSPPSDDQKHALQGELEKVLHGLSVTVEYVRELGKLPNGKFENVVREAAADA